MITYDEFLTKRKSHPLVPIFKIFENQILIPISLLHDLLYCEVSTEWRFFKGLEFAETEEQKLGKQIHETIALKESENAILYPHKKIIKAFSKNIPFKLPNGLSMFSLKYHIYGRCDWLVNEPNYLAVIDDKPTHKKLWLSDKIQDCGYGLCGLDYVNQDNTNNDKPVCLGIADRINRKINFGFTFTSELKELTISKINRAIELIDNRNFIPRENCYKCQTAKMLEQKNLMCPYYRDLSLKS